MNHLITRVLSFSVVICCISTYSLFAADATVTGKWKTFEDGTGRPKAIVQIYEQDGAIYGKVEQGLIPERAGRRCDKCTDERKGQPVLGMVIVRGLKKQGDEFAGGDILDPDNGSVYRCKLRVIEDGRKLSVRGYKGVSLLGRTQTWERVP